MYVYIYVYIYTYIYNNYMCIYIYYYYGTKPPKPLLGWSFGPIPQWQYIWTLWDNDRCAGRVLGLAV